MSIAGDHAHNDLWGLEAMSEDDDVSSVEINANEYSWRERLEKLGFKVDISATSSHSLLHLLPALLPVLSFTFF